jgi:hypothetical protein
MAPVSQELEPPANPGRFTAEASALLGPVYARFREGFETADLIRARDLLGALENRSARLGGEFG